MNQYTNTHYRVFSTWRRYFHFSYLFEEIMKKNGRYV